MALYEDISGWTKEQLPSLPDTIVYYGNNITIRVTSNRYILVVDADRERIDALETSEERRARTIDFDSLDTPNKEGQSNATELVEFWITTGERFKTQTITTTGGGGGGGDVTVIDNDTDFSTETKQDVVISKIDKYDPAYALKDTLSISVEDWQANNGGINDDPYPLIAIRKKASITNAVFLGLLTAFNEQNDDFNILVYRFNRDQIAARTGETVSWSDLDSNIEAYKFDRVGVVEFAPTASDRNLHTFCSLAQENLHTDIKTPIEGDSYEYLIAWHGHSDGSDAFVSLNPYSFNYQ